MTDNEITLQNYVDGRFDRLSLDIASKFGELRTELVALIAANDLRYQQRFEAQGKALDAAFGAAKGAVDAALAGADKAAVKTELSADKRFADLGDLIREQFKGMNSKYEGLAERVTSTESRLNLTTGETTGDRRGREDTRVLIAFALSLILGLLAIWGWVKP